MATETRVLRPFTTPLEVEQLVGSAALKVGDTVLQPDGRATLDYDAYLHVPVSLSFGDAGGLTDDELDELMESLSAVGLTPDMVLVTVSLYSSFLKISEYVAVFPISELRDLPGDIEIASAGNRPSALRTPHSGCRVETAVLLGSAREPTIGQPWRKGTWLARSRFHLSCELEYSGFTPRPMDADQKAVLGVSAKAARYVTLPAGVDPLRDEVAPDVLELWVDADLLGAIAAQPKSALSVALQRQLFVDAFNAVTSIARADPSIDDLQWSDIEDSLLGRLIRGLVGTKRAESVDASRELGQQLLTTMRSDQAQFSSIIEDHAGVTGAFMKALQD